MSILPPKKKERARPAVPKFNNTFGQQKQSEEQSKADKQKAEDDELLNSVMSSITQSSNVGKPQETQEQVWQQNQMEIEDKQQQKQEEKKKKFSMMDKIQSLYKKKVNKADDEQQQQQQGNNNSEQQQQNSKYGGFVSSSNNSKSRVSGFSSGGVNNNNTAAIQNQNQQKEQKSLYSTSNQSGLDQYDPAKPNEYDSIKMQIEQRKKGQKSLADIENQEKLKQEKLDEEQREIERMEQEQIEKNREAEKRLFSLPNKDDLIPQSQKDQNKIANDGVETSEDKALKMMKKFGFEIGKGLGKNEQGIVAPVIHQKIGDNVGILTQGSGNMSQILSEETLLKDYILKVGLTASRVIVLLNMVGVNEIDDDLEAEVIEECSLYGNVLKSLVFMMKSAPEDQNVRIFIMFESQIEAIKAWGNLHGRDFGERKVTAVFYEENNYLDHKFDMPLVFPDQTQILLMQQNSGQMELEQIQ